MTDPDAPLQFRRRDGLVVAAAVGVFGVAFGVLAVATGLSAPQAQVMSLLVFTGGSQFAAVGVIDAGGTPLAAVGSAALLAARNGMYGLSLNSILPTGFRRRAVAAQFVIDESAAMASAQKDRTEAQRAFWTTGLGVFVFWNLGTLLGAVGGNAIGDPETFGLDAAFPAGFVALMAPHLRQRPGLVAAIVGGLIALVTIPLVPAGVPILLAAFAVLPAYVVATRSR
jgi:4-azaleucine resistance transporter AzlC